MFSVTNPDGQKAAWKMPEIVSAELLASSGTLTVRGVYFDPATNLGVEVGGRPLTVSNIAVSPCNIVTATLADRLSEGAEAAITLLSPPDTSTPLKIRLTAA